MSASAQTSGLLNLQTTQQSPALPASGDQTPQETSFIIEPSFGSELIHAIELPISGLEMVPPLPVLPAQVEIPSDRPIAVVLDTPLSTRISKEGEIVTFRTAYSLHVADDLEIPAQTEIVGHVVEVRRPGHFGKQGVLRVTVDSVHLNPSGTADLDARLDSRDLKGRGRLTTDNRHSTDLYTVVMTSVEGTLLGAVIGGAKGAGIGAGAGAAAAVVILMSHKGQDVYLEPGMPFSVILNQPAFLSGEAVYAAQENYRKTPKTSVVDTDPQSDGQNGSNPKLKRRSRIPRN